MRNSHMSPALAPCYDGESQPDEPVELVDTPAAEPSDAPPVDETPEPEPVVELFSAEQLEAKLAERDREWESRFATREAEINEIKSRFDSVTMERALSDAAIKGDAYSVEVLTAFLRPHAKIVDGQPVIEIENFRLTPSEAVGWMRSQVDRFGALFKANVVSGLGGHSAAGGAKAVRGLDVRSMSPEQYRKAKKESPGLLGFGGVS